MREIKFRAIPKDMYEEYVDATLDTVSYYNSQAFDGTFIYGHLNGDYMLGNTIEVAEDYYCPSFWILVDTSTIGQYTGLKDKNGVEIYEGDIVLAWDKYKYIVKYSEDRGGWYPFATDDGCGCCAEEVANEKYSEVIGNIHENKELLNTRPNKSTIKRGGDYN